MRQLSHYVTDWLDKRAALTPTRIGMWDTSDDSEITFVDWNARVNRTANLLRSLGVGVGDVVSAYSGNRAEYVDLFLACGKIGAILHNLNWRLTVHELTGIVEEAEPVVFVYSAEWAERTSQLEPAMSTVKHVVAFDEPRDGERAFSERDTMSSELSDRPDLDIDHPWGIYYTGGTTGLPKGAVVTHGNVTWASLNTISSWGINANHVATWQLPFFHIGGPNVFLLPFIHVGGKFVLCKEFDLEQTFDLIDDGVITHYVGVPTLFQMMQAHPRWETTDFSGLEAIMSGGAPCPMPIKEKFWAKGVDFKVGYGLTEAPVNNFWLPPQDVRRKPESVGIPLFHIDMKVVRGDGSECDPDEEGELLIRGPHVIPGYWKKPEETAKTIRDGWLHTGDVARRDDEGYFTVIGRVKDMYISGGENVYPAEVESVLLDHPAIGEAAVVGIPHEKWGEVGRACIVVKQGADYDEAALLEYLRERLAAYKLPREFVYLNALPKTAIGKIDKKLLAGEEVSS
jgi:fatty-acyl-CoA synthase